MLKFLFLIIYIISLFLDLLSCIHGLFLVFISLVFILGFFLVLVNIYKYITLLQLVNCNNVYFKF